MTTLTAPALTRAATAAASPLEQLHRQLFPERYADIRLTHWTATTAVDLGRLVAILSAGDHDTTTAAALADVAHQLADVDDLGPADALDAAASVLEAACRCLVLTDVVAL